MESVVSLLFVTCVCLTSGNFLLIEAALSSYANAVKWISKKSDPSVIPTDGQDPVTVQVGLDLIKIREVDESRGELELLAWMMYTWRDTRLAWRNVTLGGQLLEVSDADHVRVDVKKLWTPDVVAYNLVHAPEVLTPTLAVVSSDGSILYVPSQRLRVHCALAGLNSARGTNCTIKFGSWTYSGNEIDIQPRGPPSLANYYDDPTYEITTVHEQRNVKYYVCCPESYPDVTFYIGIRKRGRGFDLFSW